MSAPDLHVSTDDGVLRLVIDNATMLNALTPAITDGLTHELEECVSRDDVRCVLVTGVPGAFSAGAALVGENPVEHFDVSSLDRANRLVRAVVGLDRPVVAGVHGIAAGVGCSLALACDLQVTSESAAFLLAFSRIGLTTDGGSSATVAAAMGRARAMRLALLAEPLSAREAYDAGLVSHCVPDADYDATLSGVLRRLAQGPPLSFAATKKLVNAATLHRLETALESERLAQTALFSTHDVGEGMRAFTHKERPRFTGR